MKHISVSETIVLQVLTYMQRHFQWVFFITVLGVLPFTYAFFNQEFRNQVEAYFEADDPAMIQYQSFRQAFGNEELVALVVQDVAFFNENKIRLIADLTKRLEGLAGVQRVVSLTNVEVVESAGDEVVFRRLIADAKAHGIGKKLRADIDANRLVRTHLLSPDQRLTAILVELIPDTDGTQKALTLMKIKGLAAESALAESRIFLSGSPYIELEIARLLAYDNMYFIPLLIVMLAIISALVLRNLYLVAVTLCHVLFIVSFSTGFLVLCGEYINTCTIIITPVVLGIAVATNIHVLSHFRDLINRGEAFKEAVANSVAVLWRPLFFSCLTTSIGYFSFLVTRIRPIKTVGIYTGCGVLLGLVITLFFLPSLLLMLERFIAPSMLKSRNSARPVSQSFDRFLIILGELVCSNYKSCLLVSLLLAGISIAGMARIQVSTDFMSFLPETNEIRTDIENATEQFGGTIPVELVITARNKKHDFTHAKSIALLDEIEKEVLLVMQGKFDRALSISDYSQQLNYALDGVYRLPQNDLEVEDFYDLSDEESLLRAVSEDSRTTRITFYSRYLSTKERQAFELYLAKVLKPRLDSDYKFHATGLDQLYATMASKLVESQMFSFGSAFVCVFLMMFFVCGDIRLNLILIRYSSCCMKEFIFYHLNNLNLNLPYLKII